MITQASLDPTAHRTWCCHKHPGLQRAPVSCFGCCLNEATPGLICRITRERPAVRGQDPTAGRLCHSGEKTQLCLQSPVRDPCPPTAVWVSWQNEWESLVIKYCAQSTERERQDSEAMVTFIYPTLGGTTQAVRTTVYLVAFGLCSSTCQGLASPRGSVGSRAAADSREVGDGREAPSA